MSDRCSFSDEDCATGRRYTDYAGDASGTCVPAELPEWGVTLGGATIDELTDLALAEDGRLYALGRFFDSLTSPAPLTGFENYDLLLASFEAQSGHLRWLQPIGGSQSEAPGGLGLLGDRLHLAGKFPATLRLGETELRKGNADQPFALFHAVLDDTGSAAAVRGSAISYGDALVTAAAVDGAVIAGEWSGGSIDFTAGTPGDALTSEDPAVWLARAGEASWGELAAVIPDSGGEVRAQAVLDETTAITVAGRYTGTARFGGAALLPASQQSDGYLVTFSPAPFAVQSFITVRSNGPDELTALARAGDERVAAGAVSGPFLLGGTTLPAIGVQDALVFGVTGRFRPWRAGAPGGETLARAIAAVPGDAGPAGTSDVVVAGTYTRSLSLGATQLPHRGGTDVFVARLRPDSTVVWARSFGGPEDDDAADVAVTADGLVVLGGTFRATLELGAGATRTSAGDSDGFVLAFHP